jgi:hypothetical protein
MNSLSLPVTLASNSRSIGAFLPVVSYISACASCIFYAISSI